MLSRRESDLLPSFSAPRYAEFPRIAQRTYVLEPGMEIVAEVNHEVVIGHLKDKLADVRNKLHSTRFDPSVDNGERVILARQALGLRGSIRAKY